MNTLERRLFKMETEQKSVPMTMDERERCMDAHLSNEGVTREQVIAKYGSLAAYAYSVMCTPRNDSAPDPIDGKTPAERYVAMLDG